MKLIDKDALVTDVKNRIKETESMQPKFDQFWAGQISALKGILKIINTLEVKEVDLKKELENILEKEKVFVTDNREVKYYNGDSFNHIYELEFIAKHFFELGLMAQKGE